MRCNRRITHKNNQQDTESEHADYTVTKSQSVSLDKILPHGGEDIQQDARFGADAAMLHAVLLEDSVALWWTVRVTPSTVNSKAPETT